MYTHSRIINFRIILFSILLMVFGKVLIAQSPIVNVMVSVLPPYTSNFYDYESNTNIIVSSNVTFDIGLIITIEGNNGIVIKTKQWITPQFIAVTANIPKTLTFDEIYPLFNPDNLDFTGISKDEVLSNGLPEGSYKICARAINGNLQPISPDNPAGCSNTFQVQYLQPPFIISPQCNAKIKNTAVQNIIFNWSPVPGAPAGTPYTLRLVEIIDPSTNAGEALLSATTPPFFETTVYNTSFLYGPAQPVLEDGKKYAFQVIAGTEGLLSNQFDFSNSIRFKNQGKSEPCSFVYGALPEPDINSNIFAVKDNITDKTILMGPGKLSGVTSTGIEINDLPLFSNCTVTGKLLYAFNSSKEKPSEATAIAVNDSKTQVRSNSSSSFTEEYNNRVLGIFNPDNSESYPNSDPLANTNIKLKIAYIMVVDQATSSYGQAYAKGSEIDVSSSYPDGGQILDVTTTDQHGAFTFYCTIQNSSVIQAGQTIYGGGGEFKWSATGTLIKIARIEVLNPYLTSPSKNILLTKNSVVDAGNVYSLVREYSLRVNLKSSHIQGVENVGNDEQRLPLSNYTIYILRKHRPLGVPVNELMGFDTREYRFNMEVVAKKVSDKNGRATFQRLVKNIGPNDRYYIYAETIDENITSYISLPSSFSFDYQLHFNEDGTQATNYQILGNNLYQDNAVYNKQYELPDVSTQKSMSPNYPKLSGYVKRGDNDKEPVPGAKVMIYEGGGEMLGAILGIDNNKLFRQTSSKGYFMFEKLIPQPVEVNGTHKIGPDRLMLIKKTGYDKYLNQLPQLQYGTHLREPNILLPPGGSLIGKLVDEELQGVDANVIVKGNNTSGRYVSTKSEGFIITYPEGSGSSVNSGAFSLKRPSSISYAPTTFEVPAMLGSQRLFLEPKNEERYLPYDTLINVKQKKQDVGTIKIYENLKRIRINVYELASDQKIIYKYGRGVVSNSSTQKNPVKGAKVTIKNLYEDPSLTDGNGVVSYKFKSIAQSFIINVEGPEGSDYEGNSFTITSDAFSHPDKNYFTVNIPIKKAAHVSGTVSVGTQKLENARVFLDVEGKKLEAYTDASGKYILRNVPMNIPITLRAVKGGSNFIGDSISVTVNKPALENINFDLTVFDGMVISELLGIPIEVKSIKPSGEAFKITGSFYNLPVSEGFNLKDEALRLNFSDIEISKSNKKNSANIPYALPKGKNVVINNSEISFITNDKTIVIQSAKKSDLVILGDINEKGYLQAPVSIDLSAFKVNNISFKNDKIYISDHSITDENKKMLIKTISVEKTKLSPFNLCDENGKNLNYTLFDFKAEADASTSVLEGGSLKLTTVLHTDLPNISPSDIKLKIGDLEVTPTEIKPLQGNQFTIPIEKWSINATKWTLSSFGFRIDEGMVKTGVVDVPFTDMKLTSNHLYGNAKYDLNELTINGLVNLVASGKVSFGYDAGKNHWSLAIVPQDKPYAATIGNLPLMNAGDEIRFNNVSLLSNGQVDFQMDPITPEVTLYQLVKFKASGFQVGPDYVLIPGESTYDIPLVGKQPCSIEISKNGGSTTARLFGPFISFTPNAVKLEFSSEKQNYTTGRMEATGTVSEGDKFKFNVKMVHTNTFTTVDIIPGQEYAVSSDNKIKLSGLIGAMAVKEKSWNNLVFSGDIIGANSAKSHMEFTVLGEWVASNQKIGVKNVPSDFGGMSFTYNFEKRRLEGSFHTEKDLSTSIKMSADGNAIFDNSGWVFTLTGALSMSNPKVEGQAGIVFGDYPLTPDLRTKFQDCSYIYQKTGQLPAIFPTRVSGSYFEGGISMPVPVLPSIDFNFGVISGHFFVNIGGDIRLSTQFTSAANTYGIGQSIFAEAGIGVGASMGLVCAGCSAHALVVIGFDGQYQSTGEWFVDGDASLTLSGSAYIGGGLCDSDCEGTFCATTGGSASVMFGVHGHVGTDYKEFKFYLK